MHKYNTKLTRLARTNRRAGNLSEALLWNELKKNTFGVGFTKQKPIGNYIADFYCPEKNLVIEIDGWSHDNKVEYDARRDEYMKSLGIYVLRISDIDVKRDMANVLDWIKYNIDRLWICFTPRATSWPSPPVGANTSRFCKRSAAKSSRYPRRHVVSSELFPAPQNKCEYIPIKILKNHNSKPGTVLRKFPHFGGVRPQGREGGIVAFLSPPAPLRGPLPPWGRIISSTAV